MQRHRKEIHDVLIFAQGLTYFIIVGAATVAIALAAHLHSGAACRTYETLCEARMAGAQERTLERRLRGGRKGGKS